METRRKLAPRARWAIMSGGSVCAFVIGPLGLWMREADAEDGASAMLRDLADGSGVVVFSIVAFAVSILMVRILVAWMDRLRSTTELVYYAASAVSGVALDVAGTVLATASLIIFHTFVGTVSPNTVSDILTPGAGVVYFTAPLLGIGVAYLNMRFILVTGAALGVGIALAVRTLAASSNVPPETQTANAR